MATFFIAAILVILITLLLLPFIPKIFKIENQSVYPITISLFIRNWNPIVSDNITVNWNYNGTILLPGESTYITITLENVGLEGPIIPSLDIYIIG